MSDSHDRTRNEEAERIHLLAFLAVGLTRWKILAGSALVMIVLVVVFYFVFPPPYTVRTVLVHPPARGTGPSSLSRLASQLPAGVPELIGSQPETDTRLIGAVLESRVLRDSLVERVHRMGTGEDYDRDVIRGILDKRTVIRTRSANAAYEIEVTDRDTIRAVRIANEFPPLINLLVADLVAEATQRRAGFLTVQLDNAARELEQSEERLVAYQQDTESPDIQEQTRRTVEAASVLQQAVLEQEIVVSSLARVSTPQNPTLMAAQAELETLRAQLRRLSQGDSRQNVFVPLTRSPELRLDFSRLLRDFTKNERIYLALVGALSEIQMDGNSALPVLEVLDDGVVPRNPSGPALLIRIFLAAMIGLVIGLVAILLSDYFRSARADPRAAAFFETWDSMVPWRRSARAGDVSAR